MNVWEFLPQVWPLAVLAVVVYAVRRRNRKVPDWGRVPTEELAHDADGTRPVPVAELYRRRTLWHSRNSLGARLWLTDEGLRFKIFKEDTVRFDQLRRVHAVRPLFRPAQLVFERPGDDLHAGFARVGVARATLRALPATVPLSPAAQALRDAPGG